MENCRERMLCEKSLGEMKSVHGKKSKVAVKVASYVEYFKEKLFSPRPASWLPSSLSSRIFSTMFPLCVLFALVER